MQVLVVSHCGPLLFDECKAVSFKPGLLVELHAAVVAVSLSSTSSISSWTVLGRFHALAGVAFAVSELCRLEPTVQLDDFNVASESGIQLFVFPFAAERVLFVIGVDVGEIVPENLKLVEP